MTKIVQTDPYMEFYAAHKQLNPQDRIMLRAFRKSDVEDVDELVRISRGNRQTVKTQADWEVVENIIRFYIKRWPQDWAEFARSMPDIRQSRNPGGMSKSKNMVYLAAIPLRLERLIKIIFPFNQVNSKFSHELIRRFGKGFQVGGVQN